MPGPASILILAKKKAAGPGGFFDPMAEHAGMAMGPMVFEVASEEEDEGDEPTPEKATMTPDLSKMDFRSAAAKLREIAGQLEKSVGVHAEQAKTLRSIVGNGEAEGEEEDDEEEDVEDEPSEAPMPAKVMAGPPKKGPPAFLKPKPMKY
jgi:hypothetical protein